MKITETKLVEHPSITVVAMKCDYCYEIYDQEFEMQEFEVIRFVDFIENASIV